MMSQSEILANWDEFDTYTQLKFKNTLPLNKYWVVWWYGGIRKNDKDHTQPLVRVVFREYFPQGKSGKMISDEKPLHTEVGIAYLDQIQIGTICKNNSAIGRIRFERRTFKLNLTNNSYCFESINNCNKNNTPHPFPSSLYELTYKHDKNEFLIFELDNEGKLIIPSIDYFTKGYGSSEMRRILATYMWDNCDDTAKRRLFEPLKTQEKHNEIKVRIPRYLHVSDAPFLAYIKKFRDTQEKAKLIHSQLQSDYDYKIEKQKQYSKIQSEYEKKDIYTFIKVEPWFTGEITIHVDGLSFDNSFLGLRIAHISDPVSSYTICQEVDEKGNSGTNSTPDDNYSPRPSKIWRCSIYVLVNVFTPPNSHDFASLCFCSHTRNHAK